MNIKQYLSFKKYIHFLKNKLGLNYTVSYAQCGEDIIIDFLLNVLKIKCPTYLDIGANDPVKLSNTYYFYKKGARGVLIEPNPTLFAKLEKKRKGDVCLNVGIGSGDKESTVDFYILSSNTLSTFSKKEAERYAGYGGQTIKEIREVSLVPLNHIIKNNFVTPPDFISLDTEGLDLQILQSLDWGTYRPPVFCIETLTYTENNTETKIIGVIDFMKSKDYMIYADTYINTIFVDKMAWERRRTQ